ncbi:MAG: hypothetical protein AUI45_11355 [Acidobacteria bacterium 13_1_40CM_2_56_11]|nr:MAG: hypothetical protein AUI45_11355 [Acidobacteria bacterium 13_1_40CM_2_56_11]
MARTTSPAHAAFEIGIFLKGLNGVAEIVGGLLLYFVPSSAVTRALARATQHELSEDPSDFIALHLLRLSKQFSASTQLFAAAYLLIHGVVKIALVWALYRRKLWAYPAAIAIFAAFGVYQMYRYQVSPSFAMVALTVLDAVIIVLTWIEYGRLRREEPLHST